MKNGFKNETWSVIRQFKKNYLLQNAKQLPVLTPQEKQAQAAVLRSQFPVSSGVQHRTKESEWVPVTPTTAVTATTVTTTSSTPSVITTFTEPVRLSQTLPVNQVPATPAEQSVFPEVIQQVSALKVCLLCSVKYILQLLIL